jgi:hypothetical protein
LSFKLLLLFFIESIIISVSTPESGKELLLSDVLGCLLFRDNSTEEYLKLSFSHVEVTESDQAFLQLGEGDLLIVV